jgi:hypothetical protein
MGRGTALSRRRATYACSIRRETVLRETPALAAATLSGAPRASATACRRLGTPSPPSAVAVVEDFDGEESERNVEVTAATAAKAEHVGDDGECLQLGVLRSSRRARAADSRSDLGDLGLLVLAQLGVELAPDLRVSAHGRLDDRRRNSTAG